MADSFNVFLSHNSRDKAAVEHIGGLLKGRGLSVWLDKWELQPGRRWQPELEAAIGRSRAVAVFVGTDGLGPWETPEMEVFLDRAMRDQSLPVIPVLLPGAPRTVHLPSFLRLFTWVDLRDGITDEGLTALIWGITGTKVEGDPPASIELLSPGQGRFGSAAHAAGQFSGSGSSRTPPTNGGSGSGRRTPAPQRRGVSKRIVWGTVFSGLGLAVALLAWRWPMLWGSQEPSSRPALYALRVQTLDPDGRPTEATTVRASVGNEPQSVSGGWWEIEIPEAKLPLDREITVWAESTVWAAGRVDLILGEDPNPRAEIRFGEPETWLRGRVLDPKQRGVAGAKISSQGGAGTTAETDSDGRFELRVRLLEDAGVRLRAEHPNFAAGDNWCYAGRDGCFIELGVK